MIWDLILLDWELDVLECRLTELDEVVDWFVLAEASMALSDGRPKPLHYAENAARFTRWRQKIINLSVPWLPGAGGPFTRERVQRNCLANGLAAEPGDYVLLSDVDEIPSAAAVCAAADAGTPALFEQRAFYFAVDWEARVPWLGTCGYPATLQTPPGQIRYDRTAWPVIRDAGWHLSWLGGPDGIRAKLANRCYTEETGKIAALNDQGRLYEQGYLWWMPDGSGPGQLDPVEVDATWPAWIAAGLDPPHWRRPRKGTPAGAGRAG